jgi:hypothetical protein
MKDKLLEQVTETVAGMDTGSPSEPVTDDAPAEYAPAEDAPAEEAPAEEAPAEEAPPRKPARASGRKAKAISPSARQAPAAGRRRGRLEPKDRAVWDWILRRDSGR